MSEQERDPLKDDVPEKNEQIEKINIGPRGIVGNKNEVMMKSHLEQLDQAIRDSVGYSIGVSVLDPTGRITHYHVCNSFPNADLLSSHKKVKDMIVDHLERIGG